MPNGKTGKSRIGFKPLLIVALIGMCTCPQFSVRAPATLDRYRMTTWGIADGLPQNSVLSIRQRGNREIWLGTRGGVVCFDGIYFRIFNRWTVEVLTHNHIDTLLADRSGALWIGTAGGGVCRYREPEGWRAWHRDQGLASEYVNVLMEDSRDRIWVGTGFGLNIINGGEVSRVTGPGDQGVMALLDRGDRIWAGGQNGVLYGLDPDNCEIREQLEVPDADVLTLAYQPGRGIWIGTDRGLYRYDGTLRKDSRFGGATIGALHLDPGGRLWIGTEGEGIFTLRKGVLEEVTVDEKLSRSFITSLGHDHEGNIWIGTYTGGLVKLTRTPVGQAKPGHPGLSRVIYALASDEQGDVYTGTIQGDTFRIRGDEARILPALSGFLVRSILARGGGEVWLGTEKEGVVIHKNGKKRVLDQRNGLSSNRVTCLAEDREGRIWVGTQRGLNVLTGGSLQVIAPDIRVHTLTPPAEGPMLVGTDLGLFTCHGGELHPLDPQGGFSDLPVTAVWEEPGGRRLFIASAGRGLWVRETDRVLHFTTQQGLGSDMIYDLIQGPRGNLWFSSLHGIFRISPKDFGTTDRLNPLIFTEADGMNNRECTAGVHPAITFDNRGRLYFATLEGIAVVDTGSLELNTRPPRVEITEVLADNLSLTPGSGTAVLKRTTAMMEFHFAAYTYAAPRKVQFRYRLEGWDSDWQITLPGTGRSVIYANLDPGAYRLQVTACNNHQVWQTEPAVFDFRIRRPFYRAGLFWGALAILLAGAAGYRWRSAKNARKGVQQEKYRTSVLSPDVEKMVMPRLRKAIQEDRVYLNPNLTLQDLAVRLHVHRNYLSQIINVKYRMNFKDFLNQYRIEEAKKMLLSAEYDHKTVLAVVYDAGFNSKSVFNNAFKKFTGLTPSEFRNQHRTD